MTNDAPQQGDPAPGDPAPVEAGPGDPAPVEAGPAPASPSAGGRVALPVAVPVTVALVLGVAIGLIAGWLLPRPGDRSADTVVADGATSDPAAGAEPVTVLNPSTPTGVQGGPRGSEELTGLVIGTQGDLVEVFEDYVCPFCARFELSSGAQLRQAALDGEFRLVVHPIAFLSEDSPRAANASACVFDHDDLDTWVAFQESVYERQSPGESAGQYTNEVLASIADDVGASSAATSCITDGDYLEWVAAITQQAFDRGVRGTPTLAVDGTVTDVAPFVQ